MRIVSLAVLVHGLGESQTSSSPALEEWTGQLRTVHSELLPRNFLTPRRPNCFGKTCDKRGTELNCT